MNRLFDGTHDGSRALPPIDQERLSTFAEEAHRGVHFRRHEPVESIRLAWWAVARNCNSRDFGKVGQA